MPIDRRISTMADGMTLQLAMIAAVCLLSALGAVGLAALAADRAARPGRREATAETGDAVRFLFFNGGLADATPAARRLVEDTDPALPDWQRLHSALIARFPDFPADLPCDAAMTAPITVPSRFADDDGHVVLRADAGVVRVALADADGCAVADRHRLVTREFETEALRNALDHAPWPVWRTDGDARPVWANRAFHRLTDTAAEPDRPLLDTGLPAPEGEETVSARVRLERAARGTTEAAWFDVTTRQSGKTLLHHANDITPVVRAEIAQRNFVQTLTKTFAQLSIGLVIFDRDRRLALFNPAIVDLTGLSAEFLSSRPALTGFFDALRDRQVMPEPRDYASWRDRIADVVDQAAEGAYGEMWSLPKGLTYRVTGRPHPNGAIAFLIEDISAEMSMSRRFHQQIALGQAVLDSLDEAVVIFSRQGRVVTVNAAYRQMWGLDADDPADGATALDASGLWQEQCRATPVWGEVRDFLASFAPRCEWFAEVEMLDGTPLDCRFVPLVDGVTLIGFRPGREDAVTRLPLSAARSSA